MEFNEKLQELRKKRGLTQEELAEYLYVSRTAISKWESGRGYPNISSLKDISKFFSVSIDDLLSGEKLISIAENENKSNILNICDLLFGIIDIMSIILIILPLYPKFENNYVYSVNLFSYNGLSYIVYWIMFVLLIMSGIIKVVLNQIKIKKMCNVITYISIIVSIITILFLIITRQVYAPIIAFLFLIFKGILVLKKNI
ncbi:MAG: helix-turn-helix transcriptional regulator [Oscillospiraceae bacterium]|nr:helix-turn-helix transcriptional regulator [Oscillospiraceae bacterium]